MRFTNNSQETKEPRRNQTEHPKEPRIFTSDSKGVQLRENVWDKYNLGAKQLQVSCSKVPSSEKTIKS